MDRVTSSPELLSNILGFLDKNQQVAPALTNQLWSELALDLIWRDLPSIFPLLRILGPLLGHPDESEDYTLSLDESDITLQRWNRLATYGRRVRTLYHDEAPTERKARIIIGSTYQYILHNTINRFLLLPSLQKLTWRVSNRVNSLFQIALLASTSVHTLELFFQDLDSKNIAKILSALEGRASELVTLSIGGRKFVGSPIMISRALSKPLAVLLEGLKKLENIKMHHWLFSEDVLTSLGALLRLRSVSYSGENILSTSARPRYNKFNLDRPGWFVSLEQLEVAMCFAEAMELLQSVQGTLKVTRFAIYTICGARRGQLRELLDVLVAASPSITEVKITVPGSRDIPYPSISNWHETNESEQIHLNDLAPLCRAKLSQLEISTPIPTTGTCDDMKKMARAWPGLRTLKLVSEGILPQERNNPLRGIGVSVLPLIAIHCPELRSLSLHIVIDKEFRYAEPEAQFRNLENLDLGKSIIQPNKVADMGALLAALIPSIENTELVVKICRSPTDAVRNSYPDEMTTLVTVMQRLRETLVRRYG